MTELALEEAQTALEAIDIDAILDDVISDLPPVPPVPPVPMTPKVPRIQ